MPVQINNITAEPSQRHIILLDGKEVILNLRFHPVAEIWAIDVTYNNRSASGFKVALNVLHMRSQNFPFDFVAQDLSGRGVDPFRIDDFSGGRVALYMMQTDDMIKLRGQDVPV